MAHIFCIANQKGGVGKTTTAVNLAAALALRGQRVLFVDLDPQGNGTMGCGIDKHDVECSVYQLLLGLKSFKDVVRHSESGGFDVLPANRELSGAEIELISVRERDQRLKKTLAPLLTNYDFVLIDCPPSLSMLTMNALCCAEGVIVPMQCEYFALEGISKLLNTIKIIKSKLNPALDIEGFLLTMYDSRLRSANQVYDEVKNHFQELVFKTVIQRNVTLSEAPSHGIPVILYDAESKGAKNYLALAQEIIKRNGK